MKLQLPQQRPGRLQLPHQQLRNFIQIILEDLGHVKGAARGYGAINTRVVGSDRVMLGDTEAEDVGSMDQVTPVKVSRAFLRAQAIDDPADA